MAKALASKDTQPFIGFMATIISTVIATVVLFPLNPAPRGALLFPALIMSLGICLVPMLRVLSRTEEATNAENFVCVGYVFWLLLDLLQGAYDLRDASPEALRYALMAIGVSAASVWIGLTGRPWRLPAWLLDVTNRPLDVRSITRLVPVCFVLGMLNFAYACDFDIPEMFSYIGADRWSAPWARPQLGGWGSFIDQMPYFGYVLPSLTALLIAKRGLARLETLFAIACSAIMLLFLAQGGGRRLIGITVGAALIVWVQARPGKSFKNAVVVGIASIALAWASQFILNIRSGGIEHFIERGSDYDYLHIDDNFLRLAQVIDIVPAQHPFVGSQQLIFTMVRPVPRVFWPNKPINPGFDLAAETGQKGVSLSTTIIGEWYISYGWLAVVIGGWFHGRLAKMANELREQGTAAQNPIVFALAVMVLVGGMRSMLDLVIMSYALVAWWGVNRLLTPRTAAAAY